MGEVVAQQGDLERSVLGGVLSSQRLRRRPHPVCGLSWGDELKRKGVAWLLAPLRPASLRQGNVFLRFDVQTRTVGAWTFCVYHAVQRQEGGIVDARQLSKQPASAGSEDFVIRGITLRGTGSRFAVVVTRIVDLNRLWALPASACCRLQGQKGLGERPRRRRADVPSHNGYCRRSAGRQASVRRKTHQVRPTLGAHAVSSGGSPPPALEIDGLAGTLDLESSVVAVRPVRPTHPPGGPRCLRSVGVPRSLHPIGCPYFCCQSADKRTLPVPGDGWPDAHPTQGKTRKRVWLVTRWRALLGTPANISSRRRLPG